MSLYGANRSAFGAPVWLGRVLCASLMLALVIAPVVPVRAVAALELTPAVQASPAVPDPPAVQAKQGAPCQRVSHPPAGGRSTAASETFVG